MPDSADFTPLFARLKSILSAYQPDLVLDFDRPGGYSLNAPVLGPNNQPLYFGGVIIRKNYVSVYLMPVYMYPDLLDGISPALKKRMQGKSCFNFAKPDEALFEELSALAQRSFERLKREVLAM
jgi:hypothetical protein